MHQDNPPSIEAQMIATYQVLRVGVGLLAFSLPIVLTILGLLQYGLGLQDSLSAYYHAWTSPVPGFDPYAEAGRGQMRNWFVGILWAIGSFLILYQGYGRRENTALNLAGGLLICVAMIPMGWTCREACSSLSVHGVVAVLFFFAIGYVAVFRSGDTLPLLTADRQAFYQPLYRVIGFIMWVFPLVVVGLTFFQLYVFGRYTILGIEAAGVWTFATYWLLKSVELAESRADWAAAQGQLERTPRKPGILPYVFDPNPALTQSTQSNDRGVGSSHAEGMAISDEQ